MKESRSLFMLVVLPALLGLAVFGVAVLNLSSVRIASGAVVGVPQLASPANGATLSTFGPTLQWANPAGTTQYQFQVTPIQNDGPAVNLIIGSAGSSYDIPAPPDWYGLLPDMGYAWRVRATDATTSLDEQSALWGEWSDSWTFRSPKTSSSEIGLVSPTNGEMVSGPTPDLKWSNSDPAIFYYEVQVSKDQGFGPNAFLYWSLLHGAATVPFYSYTIPASAQLEPGTTYYWRLRPRVQGNGSPLSWSPGASFATPAAGTLFLQVTTPADESTVSATPIQVAGRTAPGAIVSVNDRLATVDASGNFAESIALVEGFNTFDVIASDSSGDVVSTTLTVAFIP